MFVILLSGVDNSYAFAGRSLDWTQFFLNGQLMRVEIFKAWVHALCAMYLSRACFKKIHDCTFRPKDFLPDFFDLNSLKICISYLENSDDFFSLLVIDRIQKRVFFTFFTLTLYSSLQKQPFITAHFRSSIHILFITVR